MRSTALLSASALIVAAHAKPLYGLAESFTNAPYTCADLAAANLPWSYSWGAVPPANCSQFYDGTVEFVPMFWGANSISDPIFTHGVKALLGFNEPNHRGQAFLSPFKAAQLWPQVEAIAKAHGWRLGTPSAAPCGGGPSACIGDYLEWFDEFFGNCTKCSFDFLATHFYGCSASELTSFLASLKKYKLPIWLTEYNCGDGMKNATAAENVAYLKEALPVLDNDPDVERHAWFSGRTSHTPGASLLQGPAGGPSQLTSVGQAYCAGTL
jgi:hypothetical protein